MNGYLVVNGFLKNDRFNSLYEMLIEEFNKIGLNLILKTNVELYPFIDNDQKEEDISFIIFWDKDVFLARHLENIGYKVYNSSSCINICDDKGLMALELENNFIKMPKTILNPFIFSNIEYNDFSYLESIVSKLKFPLILKENKGSFGNEVYLINDINTLIEKVLKTKNKNILFQEYIKDSYGIDIRVMVIKDKCIGAVRRKSLFDFRSNVLQGGTMEEVLIDDKLKNLALKISKILKMDFGSVDFLVTKDNDYFFCEANSNVHFKTFYNITKLNMATYIAKYVKKDLSK